MTKNPFLNALTASIYIVLVVLLMSTISETDTNPNFFVTLIMMLSLFTLSAAVMGYIFGYQPLKLYLDGEKTKAVKLFIQTVGIFALFTFITFLLFFLKIIP